MPGNVTMSMIIFNQIVLLSMPKYRLFVLLSILMNPKFSFGRPEEHSSRQNPWDHYRSSSNLPRPALNNNRPLPNNGTEAARILHVILFNILL